MRNGMRYVSDTQTDEQDDVLSHALSHRRHTNVTNKYHTQRQSTHNKQFLSITHLLLKLTDNPLLRRELKEDGCCDNDSQVV